MKRIAVIGAGAYEVAKSAIEMAGQKDIDIQIISASDLPKMEEISDFIQPLSEILDRPLLYVDYTQPVKNKPFYYNIPKKKRKR